MTELESVSEIQESESITLSQEQSDCCESFFKWLKTVRNEYTRPAPIFVVTGYAGTGKTTIINEIAKSYSDNGMIFCTFTGKAASVLREKIQTADKKKIVYIGTIHKLIYIPEKSVDTEQITWRFNWGAIKKYKGTIIIIDEASMVPENVLANIRNYKIPVVLFGDENQLPPVNEKSVFENFDVNFRLTEIHRTVRDSPIIWLSQYILKNKCLPKHGSIGEDVFHYPWQNKIKNIFNRQDFLDDNLISLTFTNFERVMINRYVRANLLEFADIIYPSEKMIALTNTSEPAIMNGSIFNVQWSMPAEVQNHYEVTGGFKIQRKLISKKMMISDNCINQATPDYKLVSKAALGMVNKIVRRKKLSYISADYAYAISGHKSQGSEWDKVIVFYGNTKLIDSRWLYTAVTRAKKKLMLIDYFDVDQRQIAQKEKELTQNLIREL